jgi:hypothetical protein
LTQAAEAVRDLLIAFVEKECLAALPPGAEPVTRIACLDAARARRQQSALAQAA